MLSADAKLKVLVVGHANNVGAFELNRDLLQQRATAVMEARVAKYSVAQERLFPFGVS